jgi:hypothetical protein
MRPHRYALARTLAAPLGADEFGLHECDMPFLGCGRLAALPFGTHALPPR